MATETWAPPTSSKTDGPVLGLNCVLQWAELNRPNSMSKKYQVLLTNIADNAVHRLKELGIKALYDPVEKLDRGYYVVVKSNQPIRAYDTDGNIIEGDVGNGSTALANVKTYDWTFEGRAGRSLSMVKLVVKDLVTYTADDVDVVAEETF